MLKLREFEEINEITGLLAQSLAAPVGREIPEDVAATIAAARKQMEDLPEVIEELNLAFGRYLTLNESLTRMASLAEESASMIDGPHTLAVRQTREEEFDNLARVVAQEAGHPYFSGGSLNILDVNSAVSAAKILSYLNPVLDSLNHELRGQKELILEAIAETMNFLGIVAMSYPDVEGVAKLRETLNKVKLPKNLDSPVVYAPTIH
jgi:hypothetical protein